MSDTLPGLDQLRELPLPAAVPYWPQTWGWAVLAVLLLAGGIWAAIAYARRHRRNRYRRQALKELDGLAREAGANPLAARGLPALLKRTALAAQPAGQQTRVAALGGKAWLAYLDQDAGQQPFPDDSARLLATLAYSPDAAVQSLDPLVLARLLAASRHWVEHHHVAP
ncbi:DUF4381 domain-containing protein [Bordetella sp. BOR01]|uniref:DUF4381 domain-containing protein n=1 Tax=Bordetella sp. BOR01 TaxID=2854779 RepID=UPI001C47E177|nr:DUF4381 domain-containing protein [Bordetella sp. BOR01]MBV7482417.1 DUF4381 domain-containing protein [Bordetella sp. BOR01]